MGGIDRHRCPWANGSDLYQHHHDEEWGVPQRDARTLWEHLVLDGFQAGLSWLTVLRKREAFRSAFHGFDPEKVARFGDTDINRLLHDPAIIRSRAKISAAIVNARAFIAMRDAGVEFSAFVWDFVDGRPIQNAWKTQTAVPAQSPLSESISEALMANGFKFVGPVTAYAWMQAVGIVNDHLTDCFRYAELHRAVRRGAAELPHRTAGGARKS
jgi:DNA-3-methyladenine glycosylase I